MIDTPANAKVIGLDTPMWPHQVSGYPSISDFSREEKGLTLNGMLHDTSIHRESEEGDEEVCLLFLPFLILREIRLIRPV